MQKHLLAYTMALFLSAAVSPLFAEKSYDLSTATLQGTQTIKTSHGDLELVHNYTTDETSAKLFDMMDFQRASQAYIWSTPIVSFYTWKEQQNKIYAAGGRNTSKNTNQVFDLVIPEVDVFDLKKQTWETLPESSDLPTLRAGTSAVNFKGKLLIIGGESMAHKEAHNEVEALDPKTGKWEALARLNRGRHGTQAVVYEGKIYTASGSGNRGGGPELKTLEIASIK